MKRLIPFFALILSIGLFSSCEKEASPTIATAQLDDATRYLNAVTTDVLFASVKIDHQAATVSGWFLDKEGTLRMIKSNASIDLIDEIVSETTIAGLYNNSEVIRAVDKDELVSFHKEARDLALKRSMGINHDDNITSAYISYHLDSKDEDENCSDCSGSNPYAPEGTTFQQKLLISSGHLNQSSIAPAEAINDYLWAFDVELGN
jgi:hypothetical protein